MSKFILSIDKYGVEPRTIGTHGIVGTPGTIGALWIQRSPWNQRSPLYTTASTIKRSPTITSLTPVCLFLLKQKLTIYPV